MKDANHDGSGNPYPDYRDIRAEADNKEIERLSSELELRDTLLSELYQIIGVMADDLGIFDEMSVQDLLSEINSPSGKSFLPWRSTDGNGQPCPRIGTDGHNHPANPCPICEGRGFTDEKGQQE